MSKRRETIRKRDPEKLLRLLIEEADTLGRLGTKYNPFPALAEMLDMLRPVAHRKFATGAAEKLQGDIDGHAVEEALHYGCAGIKLEVAILCVCSHYMQRRDWDAWAAALRRRLGV